MKRGLLMLIATVLTVSGETSVTHRPFGKTSDGTPVEVYTLKDGPVEAQILTYGGVVLSLKAPDRHGRQADVVMGFDSLDGYQFDKAYFGGIIGRYANRIANGAFEIDGKKYSVPKNDGNNSLHGGTIGFDNVVWKAKAIADGVELTYVSKDGDQGYPGTLTATVRYTLNSGVLRIEYSATTDAPTVVNLTNHSYFNLAGQGDILGHQLKINASDITPVDKTLIPTGKLMAVESTPFDFRKATAIGERISSSHPQIEFGRGYDHNWVLDSKRAVRDHQPPEKLTQAAELYDPSSGRVLQVWTTEPGIQFYSGNFLDGTIKGKGGKVYAHRTGLCLETQHFPDSPNQSGFPSTVLRPGKRYHSVTEFRFATRP